MLEEIWLFVHSPERNKPEIYFVSIFGKRIFIRLSTLPELDAVSGDIKFLYY